MNKKHRLTNQCYFLTEELKTKTMQNQQNETKAGGKEPQPIPGQPTPDRQKPEIPEMPDKEVPEMPVRQTENPTQNPVTSGDGKQQQQGQNTPTAQQGGTTPTSAGQQSTREDDQAKEQQQPIK